MTAPTVTPPDADDLLLAADNLARQIEAVLEAATRMAGGSRADDDERASWLCATALDLTRKLIVVTGGEGVAR